MRRILMITAAAAFVAACDSSTEPPIYPRWAGELEGAEGFAAVTGEVEVAAGATSFAAAIAVEGLPDGTYAWEVAEGTCEEPGDRAGSAGSYPALTPEDGEASANATVSATVLVGSETYHAAVFQVVAEERVDVACADLERTN